MKDIKDFMINESNVNGFLTKGIELINKAIKAGDVKNVINSLLNEITNKGDDDDIMTAIENWVKNNQI